MAVFTDAVDVLARPVENYVWDTGTMSWVKQTQGAAGGGLTNAELRASPVPVSITGGGDATAANQVTGNASLASIDSKLTSPIAVTGPLTDAQLRASAVPVSLAVAPSTPVTNAGLTNLDVALSTRTKPADQQHAIIDSGSVTAVAQPGVDIGDVTINNAGGAAAVNIQDGGNSVTIDGTVTGVITSTNRSDSYTGTTSGVTITATSNPFKAYSIQLVGQGTAASLWDVRLEGSLDGSNFDQILQHTNTTGDGKVVFSGSLVAPSLYFRSRCAGLTLGTATSVLVTIVGIQ